MIYVNAMSEVAGQWINDDVHVLAEPTFDEPSGKWRALANAFGQLAIIELRVSAQSEEVK